MSARWSTVAMAITSRCSLTSVVVTRRWGRSAQRSSNGGRLTPHSQTVHRIGSRPNQALQQFSLRQELSIRARWSPLLYRWRTDRYTASGRHDR
jgi:hypothetical protein